MRTVLGILRKDVKFSSSRDDVVAGLVRVQVDGVPGKAGTMSSRENSVFAKVIVAGGNGAEVQKIGGANFCEYNILSIITLNHT